IKIINKGVSFINYTGHGDESGWLNVNIKTSDIQSFENKNMYPFIISNACRTAQFDLSNGFGTKMLTTFEKGAVGYIGCSNDSYWDEDFTWAVGPGMISGDPTYPGTGLGAYDRLFHTHGESPSDWYFTMGQINYAGNMAVSASTSKIKKYYWETYNLIGDPSVIPIIGKPGTFNVSLPDTLPNGIKSLTLNVDPFAYVAVSHFDILWDASYASASGTVDLKMPGLSNDSCLVVITGQNKRPIIKKIYFSNIHKEYLNLKSTSINDVYGNNNSRADYGESVFLKLSLSNLGMTDAHNLYVKISSASDLVTITSDSASIGTLAANSETVLSDKLAFTVADKVTDLSTATFKLILKDQSFEKNYKIDICIHAPDLHIISCTLDDKTEGNGNNTPDPGETFRLIFKVRNDGSSNTEGQFSIPQTQGDISVEEQNVKSGTLKFGQSTDIPVLVKLSDSASIGSLITLTSELNCNSYVLNKDFSFKVGKIRESFETSSFNFFPWINISSIPWVITSADSYDGNMSAKSGAIKSNESTSLLLKANYKQNDSIKFCYRVSSEPNGDFFSFKLNGKEVFKKSGEVPWTIRSVAVSSGLNIFEWIYKKDNSVDQGSDCAWVDMIDFARTGSVNYISKDMQVARIITPISKDRFGQGTVSVKILNVGKDTLNGFNLAYKINNNSYPVEEFFKNKVAPLSDSVQVFFNKRADFSRMGMYNIVAYGFNNNDQYLLNDSIRVNIENKEISDSLIIYPNPFKDIFTIYINSRISDKLQLTITNFSGAKLYSITKDIVSGKNSITINDFRSAPSLYYLNIHGSILNETIKIIKINN
ncbi:MAG TPA: C25 family cysteine peptidase, partial [Bacteroidales bacterium]|nr:C25 family cysteine peptidase [Bacteroidales bacterium]